MVNPISQNKNTAQAYQDYFYDLISKKTKYCKTLKQTIHVIMGEMGVSLIHNEAEEAIILKAAKALFKQNKSYRDKIRHEKKFNTKLKGIINE